MSSAAITRANIDTRPIFSSAQASERCAAWLESSTTETSGCTDPWTRAARRRCPRRPPRPSFSMMNSASSALAASAGRNLDARRRSAPCASCVATKNASRSWCVTTIELTSSRSRSLTISSSTVIAVIGSRPVVASSYSRMPRLRRPSPGRSPPAAAGRPTAPTACRSMNSARPTKPSTSSTRCADLGQRHVGLLVELVADVLADGQRVEERALLEHHPEVAAHPQQLAPRPCGPRARRCTQHLAGVGLQQARGSASGWWTSPIRWRRG